MNDSQFDLGRRSGPDFVVPEVGPGFSPLPPPPPPQVLGAWPAPPPATPPLAAPPAAPRRRLGGVLALVTACVVCAAAAGAGTSYLVSNVVSAQPVRQYPAAPIAPGTADAQSAAAAVLPSVVVVRAGSGRGSGFVIDDAGHVMTNSHVVSGFSTVEVGMANGRDAVARVVGTDAATDVAVLELVGTVDRPPPAQLGMSSELRIGQQVIAVGAPLGLSSTVTAGIVSSAERTARVGPNRIPLDVVQTDASINPGNSGGPLANLQGQVIGMNTAIATVGPEGGGNIGIGFAVPIDRAADVARQLIAAD